MYNIAYYDLKMGGMEDFQVALAKYAEAIIEKNDEIYFFFARTALGGDGTNEVTGVFPLTSFADMEPNDPTVQEIMNDVYGEEEAKKIADQFVGAIKNARNVVLVRLPDLSVVGAPN